MSPRSELGRSPVGLLDVSSEMSSRHVDKIDFRVSVVYDVVKACETKRQLFKYESRCVTNGRP